MARTRGVALARPEISVSAFHPAAKATRKGAENGNGTKSKAERKTRTERETQRNRSGLSEEGIRLAFLPPSQRDGRSVRPRSLPSLPALEHAKITSREERKDKRNRQSPSFTFSDGSVQIFNQPRKGLHIQRRFTLLKNHRISPGSRPSSTVNFSLLSIGLIHIIKIRPRWCRHPVPLKECSLSSYLSSR